MGSDNGIFYLDNVSLFFLLLLALSALSLLVAYGISVILPSLYSELAILIVLSVCSFILLVTLGSFGSKTVVERIQDPTIWRDVKITSSALSVTIISISIDYGTEISNSQLQLNSTYSIFLSTAGLVLFLILTDTVLSRVFNTNTIIEPDVKSEIADRLSNDCHKFLEKNTDGIMDEILGVYKDDEKLFLLKNDVERKLANTLHRELENISKREYNLTYTNEKKQLKSEIEKEKNKVYQFLISKSERDEPNYIQSRENLNSLSERVVHLGEAKEEGDLRPEEYYETLLSILSVDETKTDSPVEPSDVSSILEDADLSTRVQVEELVNGEVERIQEGENDHEDDVSWYLGLANKKRRTN